MLATHKPFETDSCGPAKLRNQEDAYCLLYWDSRNPQGRVEVSHHYTEARFRATLANKGLTRPQIDNWVASALRI
jgi:hypothetical protein